MLDLTYNALIDIAGDGSMHYNPELDPFAAIAAKQPAFEKWRQEQANRTIKAPDGSVHYWHKRTLQEARDPTGKGDRQSTHMAKEIAKRMAGAALTVMRDPKRSIADKLTSQVGANCVGKKRRHTQGNHGCPCYECAG